MNLQPLKPGYRMTLPPPRTLSSSDEKLIAESKRGSEQKISKKDVRRLKKLLAKTKGRKTSFGKFLRKRVIARKLKLPQVRLPVKRVRFREETLGPGVGHSFINFPEQVNQESNSKSILNWK